MFNPVILSCALTGGRFLIKLGMADAIEDILQKAGYGPAAWVTCSGTSLIGYLKCTDPIDTPKGHDHDQQASFAWMKESVKHAHLVDYKGSLWRWATSGYNLLAHGGMIKASHLRHAMKMIIGPCRTMREDALLIAVAWDMTSRQETWFKVTDENYVDVIAASSSVPVIFAPCVMKNSDVLRWLLNPEDGAHIKDYPEAKSAFLDGGVVTALPAKIPKIQKILDLEKKTGKRVPVIAMAIDPIAPSYDPEEAKKYTEPWHKGGDFKRILIDGPFGTVKANMAEDLEDAKEDRLTILVQNPTPEEFQKYLGNFQVTYEDGCAMWEFGYHKAEYLMTTPLYDQNGSLVGEEKGVKTVIQLLDDYYAE